MLGFVGFARKQLEYIAERKAKEQLLKIYIPEHGHNIVVPAGDYGKYSIPDDITTTAGINTSGGSSTFVNPEISVESLGEHYLEDYNWIEDFGGGPVSTAITGDNVKTAFQKGKSNQAAASYTSNIPSDKTCRGRYRFYTEIPSESSNSKYMTIYLANRYSAELYCTSTVTYTDGTTLVSTDIFPKVTNQNTTVEIDIRPYAYRDKTVASVEAFITCPNGRIYMPTYFSGSLMSVSNGTPFTKTLYLDHNFYYYSASSKKEKYVVATSMSEDTYNPETGKGYIHNYIELGSVTSADGFYLTGFTPAV